MTPEYISLEETEVEKKRLIQLLIKELKLHGLSDATSYVKKHSIIHENHTHEGFVRSLVYKMEAMGEAEVIPLKDWKEFYIKQTNWSKRHPYLYAIKIGIIGVLFSIIAGAAIALLQYITKQKESKICPMQAPQINELIYDSSTTTRLYTKKVLLDTFAKHK